MSNTKKTSITISALIWSGIILILLGVIILIFGLVKNELFTFEYGDLKFSTSQTGLVISFLGAAISYFTTKNLPQDTMVLGDKPTMKEKVKRKLPIISVIIGVISLVVFLILTLT